MVNWLDGAAKEQASDCDYWCWPPPPSSPPAPPSLPQLPLPPSTQWGTAFVVAGFWIILLPCFLVPCVIRLRGTTMKIVTTKSAAEKVAKEMETQIVIQNYLVSDPFDDEDTRWGMYPDPAPPEDSSCKTCVKAQLAKVIEPLRRLGRQRGDAL